MYHRSKKHVHTLLHPTEGESKWDKVINSFIITLIILNVIAVILETEPGIYNGTNYSLNILIFFRLPFLQ